MPTAILDLELTTPGRRHATVEGGATMVVLRYRGRPVAEVALSGAPGPLDVSCLEERLFASSCWPLWEAWIADVAGIDSTPPVAAPATIAVCSRDRPRRLATCLDSLAALPDDGQEIVVVDSASHSDAVREAASGRPGVRVVRLERPGLDRARNAALAEARTEIVAFVDDDAVVERDWLRALTAPFADPQVAVSTGLVLPLRLDTPAQEWFERHFGFGRGYERRRFRLGDPPVERSWRCGVGASLAVRRPTVAGELGGFDETLDVGTPTHGGGDNELLARVLAAGWEIEYRPDAVAWHLHAAEADRMLRKFFSYGVSWTALLWRLRRHLDQASVGSELMRALRRQLARARRPVRASDAGVPLRLLVAESAGWFWGFVAVQLSAGSPPRVVPRRAAAAESPPLPAAFPAANEVLDLDLEPGVDAAARELEASAPRWAMVRLGREPVGLLHAHSRASLDGPALRRALAAELAIGFVAAVSASRRLPAGAPPPPFGTAKLERWFSGLAAASTTDRDGTFLERVVVPEERFRLQQRWFQVTDLEVTALDAWNTELARRRAQLGDDFEQTQAEIERLELERRELDGRWGARSSGGAESRA